MGSWRPIVGLDQRTRPLAVGRGNDAMGGDGSRSFDARNDLRRPLRPLFNLLAETGRNHVFPRRRNVRSRIPGLVADHRQKRRLRVADLGGKIAAFENRPARNQMEKQRAHPIDVVRRRRRSPIEKLRAQAAQMGGARRACLRSLERRSPRPPLALCSLRGPARQGGSAGQPDPRRRALPRCRAFVPSSFLGC